MMMKKPLEDMFLHALTGASLSLQRGFLVGPSRWGLGSTRLFFRGKAV